MGTRPRVTLGLVVGGTAVLVLLMAGVALLTAGALLGALGVRASLFELLGVAGMDLVAVAGLGAGLLVAGALLARSHRFAVGTGVALSAASLVAGSVWSPPIESQGVSLGAVLVVVYWAGIVTATVTGASLARSIVAGAARPEPGAIESAQWTH